MAKTKDNLSVLVDHLLKTSVTGLTGNLLSSPLSLLAQSKSPAASRISGSLATSSLGLRSASLVGKIEPTSLKFGSARTTSSTSQSGTSWGSLLTKVASGGISNALGGGAGLFGGIASLIAGISSLFGGGKSTPPPLTPFQLPSSVVQTNDISAQSTVSQSGAAIYGRKPKQPVSAVSPAPASPVQAAQIVQTVKQALLNSSSLNDVISEI